MSQAVELPPRATLRGLPSRRPAAVPARMIGQGAAPALVVALAGLLRLAGVGSVAVNPFYDAAVRSMGTSWHAFLTGAIDPGATVSVDKPPVDLWLQVAATKVLGFGPLALHLPEALGGTLAVVALYALLRILFGREAALAGALAYAVLPVAVITARSDTMDSVMAALVVGSAALTARAARDDRPRDLVLAGAVLGLAFEVKLFEALVAVPALAALWWFGAPGPARRRALALGGGAASFGVVALAWLLALAVLGGAHQPWAFGSSNGSAWNATFVYDGLGRLTSDHGPQAVTATGTAARTHSAAAAAASPGPPGVGRLLSSRVHLGQRVGFLLAAAILTFVLGVLAGVPRGLARHTRAGWWALGGWLATGSVLLSAQHALKPRYLEAVDPALAGVLGAGLVLAVRRRSTSASVRGPRGRPVAVIAVALLAVLAWPTVVSIRAAATGAETAGAPGALPPMQVRTLSAYLNAHRAGARYQAAVVAVGKAASLVAHDGQPVLMLTTDHARPLVGVAALAGAVRAGEVRYAVAGGRCRSRATSAAPTCPAVVRWIHRHGVDVSRAAGQPHRGLLFALSVGRRTGRPRSVASRRTHARAGRRLHRASRARRRRCGHARRRCRRRSRATATR